MLGTGAWQAAAPAALSSPVLRADNHERSQGGDQECGHVRRDAARRCGVCYSGLGEVQHREGHRCSHQEGKCLLVASSWNLHAHEKPSRENAAGQVALEKQVLETLDNRVGLFLEAGVLMFLSPPVAWTSAEAFAFLLQSLLLKAFLPLPHCPGDQRVAADCPCD